MWRAGRGNCQFIESCSAKIKFSIFSFQRRINASWTFLFCVHRSDLSDGYRLKLKRNHMQNIWIHFQLPVCQNQSSVCSIHLFNTMFPHSDKVHRHWLCLCTELKLFGCILMRISEGPAVSCRLCICSILQNPPLLSLTPWNLQSHAAVLHCQLWHLVFYIM